LNPIVKGISGGGYLADNNFSIFDLSENDLKTIQTNKPNLITDQLDVSPVQSINAPDFIRKQYYDTIVKNNRGLEHLLQPDGTLLKGDLAAWDAAIKTNRKLSLIVTGDMIDRYKKTILAELRINPKKLISVASRDIRRNFDILSEFVKFNSTNIGYVQASTPRYYDLCKIAVSEIDDYDSALIYIPKPPTIPEKEYIDICKIAVSKDGNALFYVPQPPTMPENQYIEICKIAISENGNALHYVPEELRTTELCKIAVSKDGWALESVPKPPEITEKEYNEICKIAVSKDGNALRFVSPPLRTPDICKIAVSKDGNALRFVSPPLRTPDICKIAVSKDGNALHYVPEELRTTELCKIAVSKDGNALRFVSPPLRTPDICKIAVSKDGNALTYVPKELRTPKLYGIAILKDEDNWALDFVPEELRDLVQAEVEKEKAKKTESQELVRLKQLIEGLK
jgi:ribosomal protein L24E